MAGMVGENVRHEAHIAPQDIAPQEGVGALMWAGVAWLALVVGVGLMMNC